MKNKKYLAIVPLCIGLTTSVIIIGFDSILPYVSESFGNLKWAFVGIGSGLAGVAASIIMSKKMYKDNSELKRQARINENDERYIQVRKTAAYYMWFITTFVLVAMLLAFVILNLYIAIWISLGALAIHIFLYVVLRFCINVGSHVTSLPYALLKSSQNMALANSSSTSPERNAMFLRLM